MFKVSASSLVLRGETDPTKIAVLIKGKKNYDGPVKSYLRYITFKSDLKSTQRGLQVYEQLKTSGALSEIKNILELNTGEIASFREYKKAVKQQAIYSVKEYEIKCRELDQATDQAQFEASVIVNDAKKIGNELVEKLSSELTQTLGNLSESIADRATAQNIIQKGLEYGKHVTFIVEGAPYEMTIKTAHQYTDFLSAITREPLGNRNQEGAIVLHDMRREEFEILLNFHLGAMPDESDLLLAKNVGDIYSCAELVAYCEPKLQRAHFYDEQRQLSNIILSRSALYIPKAMFDVDAYISEHNVNVNTFNFLGSYFHQMKKDFFKYADFVLSAISKIEDLKILKNDEDIRASGCFTSLRRIQKKIIIIIEVVNAFDDVDAERRNYSAAEAREIMRPINQAVKDIREALDKANCTDVESGQLNFKAFKFILDLK